MASAPGRAAAKSEQPAAAPGRRLGLGATWIAAVIAGFAVLTNFYPQV
jgi:hypothetical protein